MKLNIEIDLSISEVKSLRDLFKDSKVPNVFLFVEGSKTAYRSTAGDLQDKGFLYIDSMGNCYLTQTGSKVLEYISRNNIIERLL